MERIITKNTSIYSLTSTFDQVFIHIDSQEAPVAKRFASLFPKEKIKYVESDPYIHHKGNLTAKQYSESKKKLFLKKYQGTFFKRCPGFSQKKAFACCNYHVLNLGQQCHFNCSYCYLQNYLNYPTTLVFTNIEDAIQELHSMAEKFPDLPFRVGTGEVIDSLALDPLTLYSKNLINFFSRYPNWLLELKTKSNFVDQFLDCEHAGNILVSWSINPQEIIDSEECGTASLEERLKAAKKCLDRNFKISFHIDPMIWHEEWRENYEKLLDQLFNKFTAEQVVHVSLGTLRYQPEQRHIMRERFGMKSHVVRSEMFPSENGKLRYDAGLRREMIEFMTSKFKRNHPRWSIVICMETPETWISTYDKTPTQIDHIKTMFKPLPKIALNDKN